MTTLPNRSPRLSVSRHDHAVTETRSPTLRRPAGGRFAPWFLAATVFGGLGLAPATAIRAQEASAPHNRVALAATASVDVTLDTLTVVLRVQREGGEAAAVQGQVKQVLEQALAEARRQAAPGDLEVRTGGFNLSPRYGKAQKVVGWSGTADLIVEGRDVSRVAATVGRLTEMAVVETAYSLSRQRREQHESELLARAIQRFRAQASDVAQQFGMGGYTLGEVSVMAGEVDTGGRRPMMAMKAMAAPMADAAPLPTEAGKGTLSTTVQGTVVLTR
jgi:predicted secreted protein